MKKLEKEEVEVQGTETKDVNEMNIEEWFEYQSNL